MENKSIFHIQSFQQRIQGKNCLIVGDIILDRYIEGAVSRISPEAPVPVVQVKKERYVLGGAANVAGNICGFGMTPYLCGHLGKDVYGAYTKKLLMNQKIQFIGVETDKKCTTVKTRVISMNQQIVRIDEENAREIQEEEEKLLLDNIKGVIGNVQVVILSDYNKGICTESLCRKLIQLCKEKRKAVIVDPKIKDWGKYAGASIITPNFKELKEACGFEMANQEKEIQNASKSLIEQYQLEHLLVTRSQYGMMMIDKGGKAASYDTVAQEVFDVSGAGDTVVASLASFLAAGYPLEEAVKASNYAAGLAVSKAGTYMVNLEEVYQFMAGSCYCLEDKVLSQEAMEGVLSEWRRKGKKIVFTNGCFDILHTGHITYLQKARALGDKLIVGLNSDASVKRLKGEKRPVIQEQDRAYMLSALQFVDLIILFDENTPYHLIEKIKPDILVKGGDYKKEEVVGREFAEHLEIIPFIEGYSTTGILNSIIQNQSCSRN